MFDMARLNFKRWSAGSPLESHTSSSSRTLTFKQEWWVHVLSPKSNSSQTFFKQSVGCTLSVVFANLAKKLWRYDASVMDDGGVVNASGNLLSKQQAFAWNRQYATTTALRQAGLTRQQMNLRCGRWSSASQQTLHSNTVNRNQYDYKLTEYYIRLEKKKENTLAWFKRGNLAIIYITLVHTELCVRMECK